MSVHHISIEDARGDHRQHELLLGQRWEKISN